MSTTLVPPKPKARRTPRSLGPPGGGNGFDGRSFGGGGPEPLGWSVPAHTYRTGMWMALVAIVMLARSGVDALQVVVRHKQAFDRALGWVLVAVGTFIVYGYSGISHDLLFTTTMMVVPVLMGGQLAAWHALGARGVYLATNPSSSFFYLLTAAHGVHLLGGIAALFYLALRARRIAVTAEKRTAVDVTAIYWHFMDGLWIYILALMMMRL